MAEELGAGVVCPATPHSQEAPVLKEQVVQEILARLERGATVLSLAREYDVDRKTIRAWRARGGYYPRRPRPRRSILDPYAEWLTARAPLYSTQLLLCHNDSSVVDPVWAAPYFS
jgi:hypothetical protein